MDSTEDNVIAFRQKKPPVEYVEPMFTLMVDQDQDKMLGMEMEITEGFTDFEIYIAMIAVTERFAIDSGLASTDPDTEGPANDG